MGVGWFDGRGGDGPVGVGGASAEGVGDGGLHGGGEADGLVLHAFGGHALADGVTGVEVVRGVVAELGVPGVGPVAAGVAGQPEAVAGDDDVVPQSIRHVFIIKPRPLVARFCV